MKFAKLIIINLLILFIVISVLVFSLVIFSETARFAKKKILYKLEDCIRSSCHEVYNDIPWAKTHFKEYSELKFHYETPVIWKADAFSGETINISSNYFTRKTESENQVNKNAKKAYFFGGSLMWGFGSNDINTIPSHFQNISNFNSKNFGESAWTSDQSLFFLIKLIKDGHKPDYVIFVNGVNDVQKCRNKYGLEDGVLKEDELRLKFNESIRNVSKTTFKNYFSIPLELIERIKNRFETYKVKKNLQISSECLQTDLHQKVAENLFENWKIAKNLVELNGGKFFAFLEPHMSFTNTKIDPKINFSKDSLYTLENIEIYSHLISLTKNENYIYDFKSVYNGMNDYVFIDESHVSPEANKFMAKKIFEIISEHEKKYE